jgi:hypothetical protein
MLFYCKKLSASAPLREITVPTPVNLTTTQHDVLFAQGREVNTIIKKHLPKKMLFYCKKLCASAPLREITVPTTVPRATLFKCLSLKNVFDQLRWNPTLIA